MIPIRTGFRQRQGPGAALGIEKLSKSQVSLLAKELDGVVKSFRERPLSGRYKYVWLDALEVKCREEGRIVNVACLVAVGVNKDGRREVLGLDVVTAEDGAGWHSSAACASADWADFGTFVST